MGSRETGWRLAVVAGCALLIIGCGKAPGPVDHTSTPAGPAAAAGPPSLSDKDRARVEPFANDLGPATLPHALVASYPAALRDAYELTIVRCAQCHDASRPLNSEIVDAEAWRRYVKRMMAKPGCAITGPEGKQIWSFLVHDSKVRKTGANAAAWQAHRAALLARFKTDHPERYRLLYGDKPGG